MFSKKLLASICIVFIVGLLAGLVVFRNDFAAYKSVTLEAELVHAYFKVYDVNRDAGVGYEKLVSYVIVLNITNLSDSTVRLSWLRMTAAENGTKTGESVTSTNGFVHYNRDFSETSMENYWYTHDSRLVAFSQTGAMTEIGLAALEGLNPVFYAHVSCVTEEERGGGSATVFKELHLNKIGQDEYVYGTTFSQGAYFFFDADSINTSYGSSPVR